MTRRSPQPPVQTAEGVIKEPDWRVELGLQPGEAPSPALMMILQWRANGLGNDILHPWNPDFAEAARTAQRQLGQIRSEYQPQVNREREG